MNAIQNYINALFSSLPKTPNVLRMQAEMLENLEEKYQDLLRAGKSEDEAVGIVLAGIGTVDELKAGLGIDEEPQEAPADDHSAFLAERAAFQKKFAAAIAAGVVLCICAIIAGGVADAFLNNDGITCAVFFGPIAFAVAIFVFFGIRLSWYDQQYQAICGDRPQFSDDKKGPTLSGVVSSILFPLAAMFYLYIGFRHHLWHPGWIIFPVCGIIVGGLEAVEAYRKQNTR